MNIYHARYYCNFGWGAYEEYDSIIVANSESEALGLALDDTKNTFAPYWEICQIDTEKPGAHQIHYQSS